MSSETNDAKSIRKHLEDWEKLKVLISQYEKEMEKSKQKVIDYMKDKDIDTLVLDNIVVKASKCNRESLAKADVPTDVWKKFCKESSYYVYKISKK